MFKFFYLSSVSWSGKGTGSRTRQRWPQRTWTRQKIELKYNSYVLLYSAGCGMIVWMECDLILLAHEKP